MGILNIMEDKIKSAVNDVLAMREDRFILVNYVEDIIAYVLNRVPPRYITSERGFLHSEIDYSIDIQLQADIRFCVDDAIRTLIYRREPAARSIDRLEKITRHYFFPYIVGEVLEDSSFSVIPDVEVRLLYDDGPVPMIDPGWANPFLTCNATKGYFLFWPDFLKEEMDELGDNIFKVVFHHKKYRKKEIAFSLRVIDKVNFIKSKMLPLTLLQPGH